MRNPASTTLKWFLTALTVSAMLQAAATVRADDPHNCLFCHQYRGLSFYDQSSDRLHVFFVQPDYTYQRLGPHARIGCTDCHAWSEVSVVPHTDVSKVNCTQMCHLRGAGGEMDNYSHENVNAMLAKSAHTPEILAKTHSTGGNLLFAGQSHCLYCHDEPLFRDPTNTIPALAALGSRTFDRCDVCHRKQAREDIAYYLRHIASRLQPARPSLEMAQVCAVCHSDPAEIAAYKMPDAVASWVRSFHGKAALLGDRRTADCLACHVGAGANAHLMLKPEDAGSSVNKAQLASTCRNAACHPGADVRIDEAAVHLNLPDSRGSLEFWVAAGFILLTLLTFGPSMLICVLELFSLGAGRRHEHDERLEGLARALLERPEGRRLLTRFTVSQRVQHWVLAVLFISLALTGFPMKFADRDWAHRFIDHLGGLENARFIHHWAGLALVAGLFVHLLYVLYTMRKKRRALAREDRDPGFLGALTSLPMWVSPADGLKMLHLLAHLLGLRRERPSFGRFNVKEKFEYIGVFWGTILLGVTGFMLWGEQLTSHLLTGRILNLAVIAHTYEAFLAVIHVGILHIVNVVLSPNVFPLSPATITGQTPVRELAEGHSEQIQEAARALGVAAEAGDRHD